MPGFILASDWHLSRLTWQHRPKIVGDSFFALAQVVDACIERRATLLAPGDLFDKDRPDSAAVACMSEQMSRMQAAGLLVYYVQGQHEKASPPWLHSHAWPEHLDDKVLRIPGVAGFICGIDWCPREVFAERIQAVQEDSARFLLCHQVWTEHMGAVVTVPEANVHQLGNIEMSLSGDYHKHQITRWETQSGCKLLVSPGAISVRNLGELGEKHIFYFNDDKFESVALGRRPQIRLAITAANLDQLGTVRSQLAELGRPMPEYMRRPICVFQYPAELEGAFQRINELFGDCELWLEEQRSEISPQEIILSEASQALTLPELIAANVPAGETQQHLLSLMSPTFSPAEAVRNLVTKLTTPAKKESDAA
jgi:hypothetical protein